MRLGSGKCASGIGLDTMEVYRYLLRFHGVLCTGLFDHLYWQIADLICAIQSIAMCSRKGKKSRSLDDS